MQPMYDANAREYKNMFLDFIKYNPEIDDEDTSYRIWRDDNSFCYLMHCLIELGLSCELYFYMPCDEFYHLTTYNRYRVNRAMAHFINEYPLSSVRLNNLFQKLVNATIQRGRSGFYTRPIQY